MALVLNGAIRDMRTMMHIQALIDDATCFETVRALRWLDGVCCPTCESPQATTQGYDDIQPAYQRSRCTPCGRRFDEVTGLCSPDIISPYGCGYGVCL